MSDLLGIELQIDLIESHLASLELEVRYELTSINSHLENISNLLALILLERNEKDK